MVTHRLKSIALVGGGVVALRQRFWTNYYAPVWQQNSKSRLRKQLDRGLILISRLIQSSKTNQLKLVDSKPVPTAQNKNSNKSDRSLPAVFLTSFSLWSSSSSKKAKEEAAAKQLATEKAIKMAQEAAKTIGETIQHSDQLFDENNFQEAFELLDKCPEREAYDIKWRLARALFNLSKTAPSPRKEELIRESFQHAEDALALNDTDYASHKWYSILLDAKSGLDGIKARITQLENVKKHMLKAVELNPHDATSWYILGSFYFGLADLPWYQRKIVSAIFATPPSGSYEEALECFEKAESTKPNFYSMNHLMLGKTYLALKQNDKAKEYLLLAANVTVLNEDDKQAKEEAAKLVKKL
ncbi:regulator of microtubule dynamics protein 1-like [Uranotaenia lowii]|uniref:regulator of microtubule dynamics protein 1-like n=1 Tax=Uranotaenia lowii TaxID=190385 RepID=UPI0024792D62|nr:regulator of microtubule dynamics protein 1-like [Uranotaenia lowii]